MRIACLTHTPELYGANLSMLAWLRELQTRGYRFLVVGPAGPIEKTCAEIGVDFFPFQPSWWAAAPGSASRLAIVRSLLAARLGHRPLATRLAAFKPDCLYSNSSVMPQGWPLARRLGLPHIWHLREFIDLDFGYTTALGWPFTRRTFARADATISVSRAVQTHLVPAPGPRDAVIYEGIGTRAQLETRARLGETYPEVSDARPFRFVLVGMLQANKGQALALQSLAALRALGHEARLTLVGGGPDQPLRELAGSLGIAGLVDFTGHLADPAPAVLNAHASLMFSRAEAFGRTTVEAMSLGRPVIALRRGASPELVTDGVTGLLCDPTPEAAAAAMARLVASRDMASALGRAASRAAQRYCNESYAGEMDSVFQQF
jgi:glycosyltransferase involved in cell wall biosynthesis